MAPVKLEDYLKMQTGVHSDNTSLFTGWLLTGSVFAFGATAEETHVNTGFYCRALLLSRNRANLEQHERHAWHIGQCWVLLYSSPQKITMINFPGNQCGCHWDCLAMKLILLILNVMFDSGSKCLQTHNPNYVLWNSFDPVQESPE